MTDSQEAIRLIDARGKSKKSREAVCKALRRLQSVHRMRPRRENSLDSRAQGILGNEVAHRAAQETTTAGKQPTADMGKQVREYYAVSEIPLQGSGSGSSREDIRLGPLYSGVG